MITKKSMMENFNKVFKLQNDYLAERFYVVLTGPEHIDLFKPQWLKSLWKLIHGSRADSMQFLYTLFNVAEDGKLKANEISDMLYSFQPNSKGYDE